MTRPPLLVSILAAGLLLGPAHADRVLLTSGSVYEDVVARVEGERVIIRLAGGELTLPRRVVVTIEVEPTPLEELDERRRELLADPGATADAWIALARWAHERDLEPAARHAARTASRLDPGHPALGPLLRPLGLAFDDVLGEWIPFDELMTRRGYERLDGEWLSREEWRYRLEERRLRLELAELEAKRDRAELEAERVRQAARDAEQLREESLAVRFDRAPPVAATMPLFVVVGSPYVTRPRPADPAAGDPSPSDRPYRGYARLVGRAPGSLIPID